MQKVRPHQALGVGAAFGHHSSDTLEEQERRNGGCRIVLLA
jgi:hypothetical protein